MADLVQIPAADDPRLADYVDLRDASLRKRLETENGLFIAEGDKVVRRAIESGHHPRSFLMAPRWLESLADVLTAHPGVPCFVVSEETAEQVTGFHVHRGALASLHRKPLPSMESVLEGASRVVVLEDVVDHTNVGAIFRTAAALGFDAALITPRCADPLYRRSVKVSMGAVFSLPYARLDSWADAVDRLSDAGLTTIAMTPGNGALDIDEVDVPIRLALLVGSEGPGLTRRWIERSDLAVRIPMAAGIDSLNVAAATAVACYALRPPAPPALHGQAGTAGQPGGYSSAMSSAVLYSFLRAR